MQQLQSKRQDGDENRRIETLGIRIDKIMSTQTSSKHIDVILVGLGMTIGFCVILMNLTGMWPCQLLDATGNYINVDSLQNSDQPLNKIIYDMHYWLKDLFRCS